MKILNSNELTATEPSMESEPIQEPPAGPYVEPDPELAAIWEEMNTDRELTPEQQRLMNESFYYFQ